MSEIEHPAQLAESILHSIGPLVREMRTRLGLTRSELARILKVTTRTIVRWEKGDTRPHEIFMEQLVLLVEEKEAHGQAIESAQG